MIWGSTRGAAGCTKLSNTKTKTKSGARPTTSYGASSVTCGAAIFERTLPISVGRLILRVWTRLSGVSTLAKRLRQAGVQGLWRRNFRQDFAAVGKAVS